jgi:hypothetical protein
MLFNITKILTVTAVFAAVLSLVLNHFLVLGSATYWYVSIIFFFLTALLLNFILFRKRHRSKRIYF